MLALSQVNLSWIDSATDESSYHLERSFDGDSGWTEIDVLPANSQAFADTSLSCGQIYYYRVRAYRQVDGLFSAYSHIGQAQTQSCSTLLPPPSGLTATAISHSQINLAWSDNAQDESSYHVERSPDGLTGWTDWAHRSR